jgi:alkaline phosphatase D
MAVNWLAVVSAQDQRLLPCAEMAPFFHGVASGDPLADRVILWTRLTPDEPGITFEVHWRVALDSGMSQLHSMGSTLAVAEHDFTVKVDVAGLSPNHWYYYDFRYGDQYSRRGRTRTLPEGGTMPFRMAVASCSNYEYGYFNAYRVLAARDDIDLVLHLGDYIYEYQTGVYSANLEDRTHFPENEVIALEDYRLRYSHYRLDPDLQEAHRQLPWIAVWDDHESAGNAWKDGAYNHNEGEGLWSERKAASVKAYYEWMPVREEEEGIVRRCFKIGDLIDLYMLDTRLEGRDEQVEYGSPEADSPERSLLGISQKDWLSMLLSEPPALWTVFGQQVMMAPLELFGNGVNPDQWDGYRSDRLWLYNELQLTNRSNIVVLTGDVHSSWANDLPLETYNEESNTGSIGVEYVVTSVTSPTLSLNINEGLIPMLNPHVQYVDLEKHGFALIDFDVNRVQSDWIHVNTLEFPDEGFSVGASFLCREGQSWLESAPAALPSNDNGVPKAPVCPFTGVSSVAELSPRLISVYPNPFFDRVVVQFALWYPEDPIVTLYDTAGKVLYRKQIKGTGTGINYLEIKGLNFSPGGYILAISGADGRSSVWMLQKN